MNFFVHLLSKLLFRREYYASPDDEAFRLLASVYSHSHYNMSMSKDFPGGITNGAAWWAFVIILCNNLIVDQIANILYQRFIKFIHV